MSRSLVVVEYCKRVSGKLYVLMEILVFCWEYMKDILGIYDNRFIICVDFFKRINFGVRYYYYWIRDKGNI